MANAGPPRASVRLLALLSAAGAAGATAGQTPSTPEPKRFTDPAPPTVHELPAVEVSPATGYPELRFHAAPRRLAAGAVTESWPGFLGPRRDSHSLETPLLQRWPSAGPRLVWEMERGEGYASPVVHGDRVVFTHRVGNSTHVDCLETETGKRFWRFSFACSYRGDYIPDGGPRSTPAIAGGRVYVHGVENTLHCLDLASGRLLWKRDLAAELKVPIDFFGAVSSPLVAGGLLIQNVGATGGPTVAAFDLASGRLVWGCGEEWGPSCASPILAEVHGRQRVFVLAGGQSRPPTGGLMVLDPETGALDLTHPFRSNVYESVTGSSPVVGSDWVFLSSSYGVGSAVLSLSTDGGFRELWRKRGLGLQFSNAVLHDGHLYMIDGRSDRAGAIVCLDPKTGDELSRTDVDWIESVEREGAEKQVSFSIGEGSLLFADGGCLCLGDNGHLLLLDVSPKGTKVRARTWLFGANESWTPLALSRGLLYVCQNKRARFGGRPPRLLCYDLRGGD